MKRKSGRRAPFEDEDGRVPLARLFAMALHSLITDLHQQLDQSGFEDARPSFGVVLLAARDRSVTAKQMAELTGTSKQAAAKLLATMEAADYLRRVESPTDRRERPLKLTRRGHRLLRRVEAIYRELEAGWAQTLGVSGVEAIRSGIVRALHARHGGQLPPVRPS